VAIELARDQPIDVAIVDLMLPGMSGSDLATALKRLQPCRSA